MGMSYDRFLGLSTQGEGETDSQFLARRTELILRKHGVKVDGYEEVREALEEIASADLEETPALVMDLLGTYGLEPEAFEEVEALSEGVIETKLNASQQIAEACARLFRARNMQPHAEHLKYISTRSARAALGMAADLLVGGRLYESTQAATAALDPDGEFSAAADRQ